jgi:hypothetical protein
MCKKISLKEKTVIKFVLISTHNLKQIQERLEDVNVNLHTFSRVVDKQEKLISV